MEKEKKVLVLIDADSLIYQSSKEDLFESMAIIDEKIKNIFEKTRADFYSMFISQGGYFRNKIDPAYKNNRRKYPNQLLWTKTLKNYLIEKYGAMAGKEVEADDLVSYFYNKEFYFGIPNYIMDHSINFPVLSTNDFSLTNVLGVEVILASPDKDLLRSIPGKHFNYTYRLEPNTEVLHKGWWVETTKEESEEFLKMQMVVGDSSDGIAGIPGRGPKYWEGINKDKSVSWGDILQDYISHFDSVTTAINSFSRNFRLLKMLSTEPDFYREVGYLPTFEYREVIKPEEFNMNY